MDQRVLVERDHPREGLKQAKAPNRELVAILGPQQQRLVSPDEVGSLVVGEQAREHGVGQRRVAYGALRAADREDVEIEAQQVSCGARRAVGLERPRILLGFGGDQLEQQRQLRFVSCGG